MGSHRYQGDEIAVTYEVKRCIHATECVRGLPSVFDPERRPWVRLEGASAEEVVRVVEPLHIILTKNGPLRLLGPVVVRSTATGVACPAQRLSLCRCGGSQNKPYCDGSHGRIGFEA